MPDNPSVQTDTGQSQQLQPQIHGHYQEIGLWPSMRPSVKGKTMVTAGQARPPRKPGDKDGARAPTPRGCLLRPQRFLPLPPRAQATRWSPRAVGGDVTFGFTNFSKSVAPQPLCRKSRNSFKASVTGISLPRFESHGSGCRPLGRFLSLQGRWLLSIRVMLPSQYSFLLEHTVSSLLPSPKPPNNQ